MSSITGSVAELFATLGLDATQFGTALAESEAMLKSAGADMSLTLKELQVEHSRLLESLGALSKPITALEMAYDSLGISGTASVRDQIAAVEILQDAVKEALVAEERRAAAIAVIEGEIVASLQLEVGIRKEIAASVAADAALRLAQEKQGEIQSAAILKQRVAQEREAVSIMAGVEKEYTALWTGLLKEREAAEKAAAAQRVAVEREALRIRESVIAADMAAQVAAEERLQEKLTEVDSAGARARLGVRIGAGGIAPTGFLGGPVVVGAAVAGFAIYETAKAAATLDDALNKSLSIMGNVSAAMKGQMKQAAEDLAAQYGVASADIAKAFYHLASSGMDAEQSLSALPTVVKFAFTASTDGVMNMGRAAELLTTTVNALHGAGGSIEHVADLLLAADRMAAGTGEQFAQALAGKGAGAIRILGKDMEEGLAILATYSMLGMRGAEAQGAMVQVLRDFRVEAERHKNVIITLNGVQTTYRDLVYDSTGKMKNLADILTELETLFQGASTATITHDLALMGLNKRTTQAIQPLIGMSDEMRRFEENLRSSDSAMSEIVDKRLDSAVVKFDRFKETIHNLAIEVGDKLLPGLTSAAELLTKIVSGKTTYGSGSPLPNETDFPDPAARLIELRKYLKDQQSTSKALRPGGNQRDQFVKDTNAVVVDDLVHSADAAAAVAQTAITVLEDKIARGKALLTQVLRDIGQGPKAAAGDAGESGVTDPDAEEKARKKAAAIADKAARDRNALAVVEITEERDHNLRLIKIEEDYYTAKQKLDGGVSGETLAALHNLRDSELQVNLEADQKLLALEHTTKSALSNAKAKALESKAQDQRTAQTGKEDQDAAVRAQAEVDHETKAMADIMAARRAYADKVAQYRLDLDDKVHEDQAKAHELELSGELSHSIRILELWRQRADSLERAGKLTADQRNLINDQVNSLEENLERDSLNKQLTALDEKYSAEVDYASKRQDLLNRIQALDDARLKHDQTSREQVTKVVSQGMQTLLRQSESMIRSIGSGIGDLVTEGGKFGDRMDKVAKNIVKSLVTDVVEYGFGKVLMAIFNTDSALYNLGKKLSNVFGSSATPAAAINPGQVSAVTPPFVDNNALKANTEQIAKGTAGAIKNTAATVADTSSTQIDTRHTSANTEATGENTQQGQQPNTEATKLNTDAMRMLTESVRTNTAADEANTVATDANTVALWALTGAITKAMIIGKIPGLGGGASGGGGGGFFDFGFGNDPSGGYGYPPFGGGGGGWGGYPDYWDYLNNLGNDYTNSMATPAGPLNGGSVHLDFSGAHFSGVTHDLVAEVMNKAVDRTRLNRGRV